MNTLVQTREPPIRLLLVDDHPLVRDGLRARLDAVPQIEVVGEAGSGEDALSQIELLRPDLALVDVGMRGMNGIQLTEALHIRHPEVAVLILSMYANGEYVAKAIRAGARGYVLKDSPSREIIAAITAVAAGGSFFGPGLSGPFGDHDVQKAVLTDREREVLILVAKGQSNKLVARELDISVRTVETHRLSLRRKLDIDTAAGLVKYALEQGWIDV
jgi:two-component system, NarL family, nitrate/nitrite response regulator NarL